MQRTCRKYTKNQGFLGMSSLFRADSSASSDRLQCMKSLEREKAGNGLFRPYEVLMGIFLLSFNKLCVHLHVHKITFKTKYSLE